ncbi:hypothetical protein QR680_016251 [Steinernema hermaphroditum]|uniref:Serpentine receptor class gamma n=1 Tax=Steinernema hermaphroditum TaxID=289476 RepID=A0AA39LM51_9BILA|nr:hypothetical protein QR680_016251 [Steinernema hermaphroditum]
MLDSPQFPSSVHCTQSQPDRLVDLAWGPFLVTWGAFLQKILSNRKISLRRGMSFSGLWEAQLSTCVLLAFNRLMEFWNAKCISRYFDGRRVFFWFIGPIAIGVFYAFHGSASLFNSTYWNWLQDPYIGTDIEHDPESYISNSAIYANMTCEIVIAIMYTVLVGSLIWQSRKANAKVMSKLQRSITIQSALLTSLDFVTGFAYVYMNYGVAGEPLIVFSLITYQASCGIGGVVYIAFNKTIRSQLLPHFPKNTIAVVSITPNRVGNPN